MQSHKKEFTSSLQTPLFWHGVEAHSSIFVEQFWSVYPGRQLQMYDAAPTWTHVELLMQNIRLQISFDVVGISGFIVDE
jgi:hypothetical protein